MYMVSISAQRKLSPPILAPLMFPCTLGLRDDSTRPRTERHGPDAPQCGRFQLGVMWLNMSAMAAANVLVVICAPAWALHWPCTSSSANHRVAFRDIAGSSLWDWLPFQLHA